MLIYANEFFIKPGPQALDKIKTSIKAWLDRKIGATFKPIQIVPLAKPFRNLHPRTGTNEVSIQGTPDHASEYYLAVSYQHNDDTIHGRSWITRIGLERTAADHRLRLTIILETAEVSPLVAQHPVTPTKPGIVAQLLMRCELDSTTPGVSVRLLTPETKQNYLALVNHRDRAFPLVIVSVDDFSEQPFENPDRLQEQLVGLAQVFFIADKHQAWALRELLPSYHTAWNGAITLVGPSSASKPFGRFFLPDEMDEIAQDTNQPFGHYLLAEITHRQNFAKSMRHISADFVSRKLMEHKIAQLRAEAKTVESLDELVDAYEAEKDQAIKRVQDLEYQLLQKDETLDELQRTIADRDKTVRTLQYRLKEAAKGPASSDLPLIKRTEVPETLIEVGQRLIAEHADKIVLTNHAEKTLRDSPFTDIPRVWKAFQVLVEYFYGVFTNELKMQDAIDAVRGLKADYSGNNSEVTAGKHHGYERQYNNRRYTLNKHISLGSARDPKRCFRLYFAWEPTEEKIIVLHAGEHLKTDWT